TDVFEGVVTLDRDKFRAGTTALRESAVSIVRIPRNQVRHWYVLVTAAEEERRSARAAVEAKTGPGSIAAMITDSAPNSAASAVSGSNRDTADDQLDAPTGEIVGTENVPSSPAPSAQTSTSDAPDSETDPSADPTAGSTEPS